MKKINDLINKEEEKKLPSSRFNIILEKQEVVQLTTVPGADPSDNLLWHSADEEVATVTNLGKVTAIDVGRTQIHVENETLTFEDLINIKVVGEGEARDLRLAIQLKISEVVKLSLEDAEYPVWESLDSSVAVVSETGQITGVSEGIALITATYGDEVNVIYVKVEGNNDNDDIDLAHKKHFDKIKEIIISNENKVTTVTNSTFGNLDTSNNKWLGGVLAQNGKIYGIPANSGSVLELDPNTKEITTIEIEVSNITTNKYSGGVLANNGKIYCIPRDERRVLEIEPGARTVNTFGSISTGIGKWYGGVLAQNGKIYGIPDNANTVLEIDPETNTTSTFGNLGSGGNKWQAGVLAPNGKIYGIPWHSTQILEINPENKTVSTFGNLSGRAKWVGGVLALNGKIYCIPSNSGSILEIDPKTRTTSIFGSVSTSAVKWYGGVLAPNGKIYGIPCDSSTLLEIDPEARTIRTFGSVSTSVAKWCGGVLAPNGNIYGIPNNSPTVLEINLGNELKNFDFNEIISSWINKY